jgi:Dolichyl-phosphate-mannose-protein mannosyltransferase
VMPAASGFLLASTHSLTATSAWLVVVALTAIQFRTIVGLLKKTFEIGKLPFDAAFPLLLTLPIVILNFIWAVAPEVQFDANNYHLTMPKIYLANGGFIDVPYALHSYEAHLVETVFVFPMALHGQAAAKLLSFILSIVAGCGVLSLGKATFNTRVGSWAAAFFYTTPVVSWLAGTAYTDNIVTMFMTAALLAFIKWYAAPSSTGWIYIIGALGGLAVAAKMNAAFGLLVVIAIVCWNARRISLRRAAVFLMLMAAIPLPWFVLIYHWTGNPIFPLLNGFFKSPLWDQDNKILNSGNFGIGTSLGAMARLPFRFVFNTERFGESSPRGSVGLAVLIAFPFGAVLWSQGKRAAALLGTAAVYWLVWSYTFQYARYFVSMLPVVCVLASAAVLSLNTHTFSAAVRRTCLALGLILQFPSLPVQFWNIRGRFPVRLALGLESREHFLDRALLGYAAVTHLNKELQPGDRVIGVDVEQIRLYLNAPLETLATSTVPSKLRAVVLMPPTELLHQTLKDAGFKYILVTRSALQNPPESYPYLKEEFLTRFATIVYMDSNALVYRLNA